MSESEDEQHPGADGPKTEKSSSAESQSKLSDSDKIELHHLRAQLIKDWEPKGTLEQEIIHKIAFYVFKSRRANTLALFNECQDRIEALLDKLEDFREFRLDMLRKSALEKRWRAEA